MIRTVGMMVRDPNTSLGADDGEAFRGSVDELARVFDACVDLGIDHLILEVAPEMYPDVLYGRSPASTS